MTVSFSELFELARGEAKVPKRILVLDPGETTGFAIFEDNQLVRSGQISTVQDKEVYWEKLYFLMTHEKYNYVVCEDYRIYQHKLARHSFSPVLTLRIIGGIDLLATLYGVPIHYQMATQAKGFVTDAKLKEWGFWAHGQNHARDAIRHGCYFLLFHKRGQDII